MINAHLDIADVSVHLGAEDRVYCVRQANSMCPIGYAVLHFGNCTVFPSDQQLMKLAAEIHRYLDGEPVHA